MHGLSIFDDAGGQLLILGSNITLIISVLQRAKTAICFRAGANAIGPWRDNPQSFLWSPFRPPPPSHHIDNTARLRLARGGCWRQQATVSLRSSGLRAVGGGRRNSTSAQTFRRASTRRSKKFRCQQPQHTLLSASSSALVPWNRPL